MSASPTSSPITYRPCIVTYLDLLGFTKLVEDTLTDVTKVEGLASLLSKLKEKASSGARIHRRPDGAPQQIFNAFNFSDLTVRCTEFPEDGNIVDFLNWELTYVSEMQLTFLLNQRVLIRGGICLDQIATDPARNIVFGPGLVKSYKLESEYAIYPRIVIDRDFLTMVEERPGVQYWQEYIRRGDDGAYFIDYLYGVAINNFMFPEYGETPRVTLSAHRDFITSVINDNVRKKPERLRQKYMWLALYHNSTVRKIAERIAESGSKQNFDDVIIPQEMLRF